MARFRSLLETKTRNINSHNSRSDKVFLLIARIDDLAGQLDQQEDDERSQVNNSYPTAGEIKALHRLHSQWEENLGHVLTGAQSIVAEMGDTIADSTNLSTASSLHNSQNHSGNRSIILDVMRDGENSRIDEAEADLNRSLAERSTSQNKR